MEVDCIIVANLDTPRFRRMTGDCASSIHRSETNIKFNIVIIQDTGHEDFNYNKMLCEGLKLSNNEWVILSNNDLIFYSHFFREIRKAEKETGAESFSSWNQGWHEKYFPDKKKYYFGYRIGKELCGWMIATKRTVLEKINFCSEESFRVSFWRSDDIYADLLKENEIKHCLVRDSKVTHLLSQTLRTKSIEEQQKLTVGQRKRYDTRQV